MSDTSPEKIEAEIARTRAALQATVDELSDRLDPRAQLNETVAETKVAVADLKRRISGEEREPGAPEPTARGWAVLGTAAGVAVLIGLRALRR